jgi:hypothetical protein
MALAMSSASFAFAPVASIPATAQRAAAPVMETKVCASVSSSGLRAHIY